MIKTKKLEGKVDILDIHIEDTLTTLIHDAKKEVQRRHQKTERQERKESNAIEKKLSDLQENTKKVGELTNNINSMERDSKDISCLLTFLLNTIQFLTSERDFNSFIQLF